MGSSTSEASKQLDVPIPVKAIARVSAQGRSHLIQLHIFR